MEKDSNIELEEKEKEKQIQSMESAIARLQSITTKTTVSSIKENNNQISQESIDKISEIAKQTKTKPDKKQKSNKKTIDVDYSLNKDELNPSILDDKTLSEKEDALQNKSFAWLAYILFFIPLLINRKSPFVRLHANEGLDVFIIDVIASILMICGKFIPFSAATAIIGHIMFLAGIGLFILTTVTKIFQIIRVFMGKKNQTPWLWKTRIIK